MVKTLSLGFSCIFTHLYGFPDWLFLLACDDQKPLFNGFHFVILRFCFHIVFLLCLWHFYSVHYFVLLCFVLFWYIIMYFKFFGIIIFILTIKSNLKKMSQFYFCFEFSSIWLYLQSPVYLMIHLTPFFNTLSKIVMLIFCEIEDIKQKSATLP